jgi:SAM-dependent methyltransferase
VTSQDLYVHDHSVRGRFNAEFFTIMGGYLDRLFDDHKSRVLDGLSGTVVEIGPGIGGNLGHYEPGTRLVAVEPNRRMHPHLRRRARASGIDLQLLETGAEAMDLPDASVGDVVSTLVLCTVTDPVAALREIRRVLRPGGRFRFIEHVVGEDDTVVRRVQRIVRRPWRWLFEGCNVDRPTGRLIEDAGFRSLDMERFVLRSPFVPANPGVAGIAIR